MLTHICVILIYLHTCISEDFTYHIREGESPGTLLGNVAIDTHLMDNISSKEHSIIKFSHLEKEIGSSSQLFNVSKRGELYTAKILDAEFLCKYNVKCFKMVDIAVRRGKSFLKVLEIKVRIEDVNDHQPEFPENVVSLHFAETDRKGTRKSIPHAVDKDVSMMNSQITYELIKNEDDPFALSVSRRVDGSYSLGIILKRELDREVKDIYLLQVIGKDGGTPSKHGILDVQISVTDENDNPPIFSKDMYNVTVNNRHSKEIPVLILSATDLDSGKNGNVSYYFSSMTSDRAKSCFEINENTGEIFLHKNYKPEKKQTYKLFIEARDNGSPPLSSVAPVVVNIINNQNTAPVIEVNFSERTGNTATISEAMEVGSFIAYVKVVDNDIGLNGQVTCDLQHNKFTLQSLGQKRYKVSVKEAVDRETESKINFTITCSDRGSPSLTTEHYFSLKVTDVNDVKPQFAKETFKFLTYENEMANFPVGFINVTDSDLGSGSQLSYFLFSNIEHKLPFRISDFGFISTTESLDREQQEVHRFKVLVKDNGTPSLSSTANVIIEVMDENDNAPYFTFPSFDHFSLDVFYQPQSKNDITVLRASDRDSRQNSFIKFEIFGGNSNNLFSVNPYTGVLSFSRFVYQNDAGSYDLLLKVKDSGIPVLSATTTLSLTLTVSNKTSTKMTTVQFQSDDRIHINLFIIIIVAAVTVSILLVVSITVCIIRRKNNQRHTPYQCGTVPPQKPLMSRGRQSEYFCATQPSSKHELNQKGRDSTLEIHSQPFTKGIHQKCSQQEVQTYVGWTEEQAASVPALYRYSDMRPESYVDSAQGICEGNMVDDMGQYTDRPHLPLKA
ncbi:protocadherin beta-15-like isoform X4 [Argonauta hians]